MSDNRYQILRHRTPEAMSLAANELMGHGWQPAGGPRWHDREQCWVQAMFRPDVSVGETDGEMRFREGWTREMERGKKK